MLWRYLDWCLPVTALNRKRQVFAVANWTALSENKVVLCHICCCQSITGLPVFFYLIRDQFPSYLKQTVSMIAQTDSWSNVNSRNNLFRYELQLEEWRTQLFTKQPHSHLDFPFCSWSETYLCSHPSKPLLKMRYEAECLWRLWAKYCQYRRCLSFLKRRVSSYSWEFHGNSEVPGSSLPLRVSSYSRTTLHLFCHSVLIVFSR